MITEPSERPYPEIEIYGGDPDHAHGPWTWVEDDGNGHMGHTCPCGAFRP